MTTYVAIIVIVSIASGFISAGSWLYASIVKVSHEREMERRRKKAERKGEKPNLASISLDGWDMSSTFSAQSRWNAIGAIFAAISILLQALIQLLDFV
ncbi:MULTISPECIES: hypothetical protein [unclassified Pseudomonas]|uniref:hypothetical protein n=1 Tax=unclassified Pseudomonas TaxID=196821 RepID=UPI0012FD01F2|nr:MULTISPECIES: hypothetical protein [unclassified Pseudomonas]MCU1736894.1 hypothetical protein [Pseudomonas sp. 20S_6.2_Bac1]